MRMVPVQMITMMALWRITDVAVMIVEMLMRCKKVKVLLTSIHE